MDWQFQHHTLATSLPSAANLAKYLLSCDSASTILLKILSSPAHLHVPVDFAAIKKDHKLVLEIMAAAPLETIPILSLWRKRGPVAQKAWAQVKGSVCGYASLNRSYFSCRPDVFAFIGRASFLLVKANAPADWLDNAVSGTWPAPLGGRFCNDVLECKRLAQLHFARANTNAFILLHGKVGIRCTYSDSLVLVLLLFFGPLNYSKKVPFYAPRQLQEAGKAKWLT